MKGKKWLMGFINNIIPDGFEITHCSLTFNDDGSVTLWITNKEDDPAVNDSLEEWTAGEESKFD